MTWLDYLALFIGYAQLLLVCAGVLGWAVYSARERWPRRR